MEEDIRSNRKAEQEQDNCWQCRTLRQVRDKNKDYTKALLNNGMEIDS